MTQAPPPRRPPGLPAGSTTGPRPGSRAWQLANMKLNDKLVFIVPEDRSVTCYMGQIGADIGRADMRGRLFQTHGLVVDVGTAQTQKAVIVERRN